MEENTAQSALEYGASKIAVAFFYIFLTFWTVLCLPLIALQAEKAGWSGYWVQGLMIVFVFGYTWYWSLGISYRIRWEEDGTIVLTSFRREIRIAATGVAGIEGPPFRMPFGFMKFKLEREKIYLFCLMTDKVLQEILARLLKENPGVKVKFL
jgi:hypothetical protein